MTTQDDRDSRKAFEAYYERMYPNTDFTRYKDESYAYKNDDIDDEWYLWDEAYHEALAHERQLKPVTADDRAAYEAWALSEGYFEEVEDSGTTTIIFDEEKWQGFQVGIAHERQLKPVQADDLIRRSDVIDVVNNFGHKIDIIPRINTIPAISNTVEAVATVRLDRAFEKELVPNYELLQSLEVGTDLFTTPPQSKSVKDALEAAASICEELCGHPDPHYDLNRAAFKIRALINDKKEG